MTKNNMRRINHSTAETIYAIVSAIPRGSVMTYGQIAKRAKLKSARTVGYWLHRNPNPRRIPCHRVVNAKGHLARAFAFGGLKGQAERLKREGLKIAKDRIMDFHIEALSIYKRKNTC